MDYKAFSMNSKGIFSVNYALKEGNDVLFYTKRRGVFTKFFELYNAEGTLLYVIKKPVVLGKATFELYQNDEQIAVITKSLLTNEFEINGSIGSYHVIGHLFNRQYTIQNSVGTEIGKISRKLAGLKWSYGLGLEVNDTMEYLLSVPIIIDLTLRRR